MNIQAEGGIFIIKVFDIFYHKKAVEICNDIGNASGSMSNQSSLGYAYKNTGDLDKGLVCLESSLEIAEELDDKRFIKGLLSNIADALRGVIISPIDLNTNPSLVSKK